MPLPGGASNKIGNRYEAYWTLDRILEVMRRKAKSMFLEPPGPEGNGIEFFITRDNEKEYHQVKRQRSRGQWTIKNLRSVLNTFWEKLRDNRNNLSFLFQPFLRQN